MKNKIENKHLNEIFESPIRINNNIIGSDVFIKKIEVNQKQTKDIFSNKWTEFEKIEKKKNFHKSQLEWFLTLYGFSSEQDFKLFLSDKKIILDAGCGLGYKSAWFAELAPNAKVIGIDISDSITIAAENYKHLKNLFFYRADIAKTGLKKNSIDFTVCDQVIMHTEAPEKTFRHLSKITSQNGEFACYVYRKKALPRELLDDHFRLATHDFTNDQLWEMSAQLTELGKRLSDLKINIDSPDIPLLGIKGGTYDLQRFIYWNFIKCFWREDWGKEMSDATNFDWYAPSNAKRYTESEFKKIIQENKLRILNFHKEEACFSTRMLKKNFT